MITQSKYLSTILGKNFDSLSLSKEIDLSTDTRNLQPGCIFVAIKGENFDGNHFIDAAFKKGAVAVVASDLKEREATKNIFNVPDTTDFLRQLAYYHRQDLEASIFAIGGSNGKTTTKEYLRFLSASCFGEERVFSTQKSENSVLGLAMNILRIRPEHEVAILEVGIDEPGWMQKHLQLLKPQFGLLTTIQEEHLLKLKNIETVAEEELKLLQFLRDTDGSFAANLDSPWIRMEEFPQSRLTYSLERTADIEGLYKGSRTLHAFGQNWENPLPGKHNAQNLLAALTSLRLLQPNLRMKDFQFLAQHLKAFSGAEHRSRYYEAANAVFVFDDCYNANPGSMEAAMSSFIDLSEGLQRIAVLGEMRELAGLSEKSHLRILNLAAVSGFEKIFTYGDAFKPALDQAKLPSSKVTHFESFDELRSSVSSSISSYQAFFIKGSRGNRLERLLDLFKVQ